MFKLIPGNWINIYLIFTVFYSLPLFLVSSVIFQSISDFSGFNPAFKLLHFLSSLQFRSVTQLCLTLCNPMDCSTPGFPVLHQLPELTQTHVHRVSDAIQPSHPLLSPSSLTFNLSQHQGLFQWVSSSYQVAKVLEPQLQHQSFQWMFRTDLLWDGLVASPCSPRDSESLLQHHSSKASVLRCSAFFIFQFSHPYMTLGKTIALTR